MGQAVRSQPAPEEVGNVPIWRKDEKRPAREASETPCTTIWGLFRQVDGVSNLFGYVVHN